jgi:protein-tyrosine phosphatase
MNTHYDAITNASEKRNKFPLPDYFSHRMHSSNFGEAAMLFFNPTAAQPQRTGKIAHVDHVINGVYISSYRATSHASALRRAGITHVLKLYTGDPMFPRDFDVFELTVPDGQFVPKVTLNRGVDFVLKQVDQANRVLVVCAAGISRSATFVLSYLLECGYDIHDAYDLLFSKHPEADPHPHLWQSLMVHHELPYSLEELLSL